MLILQLLVEHGPVRLDIVFEFETNDLVLKWVELSVVLFFFGDRLQTDKFMVGTRAATAENGDEEEESDACTYEQEMLESEKDENETDIKLVLSYVEKHKCILFIVFMNRMPFEFFTQLD